MQRRQRLPDRPHLAEALQRGDEPDIAAHPEWFRQAPLEVVSAEEDMPTLWEQHHTQFVSEFATSRPARARA